MSLILVVNWEILYAFWHILGAGHAVLGQLCAFHETMRNKRYDYSISEELDDAG